MKVGPVEAADAGWRRSIIATPIGINRRSRTRVSAGKGSDAKQVVVDGRLAYKEGCFTVRERRTRAAGIVVRS